MARGRTLGPLTGLDVAESALLVDLRRFEPVADSSPGEQLDARMTQLTSVMLDQKVSLADCMVAEKLRARLQDAKTLGRWNEIAFTATVAFIARVARDRSLDEKTPAAVES